MRFYLTVPYENGAVLLLGGAVGIAIDRLLFNRVTDMDGQAMIKK